MNVPATQSIVTPAEALGETIKEFRLSRGDLAERSRVSESSLSRYLDHTNDMGSRRLQSIIDCLPPEARSFYYSLLDSDAVGTQPLTNRSALLKTLRGYIENCNQKEYLEVLGTIIEVRKQGETSGKAVS